MRLPELARRPANAERPSLATVRPTDLGLGAVAQDVREWQAEVDRTRELETEVQQQEDEKAVQPALDELRTGFETRFSEAGAAWDGITPGFARGVTSELDTAATPLLARPDLTPGQRDALTRGVSQYKEATGQRAIQYQAQRRGALVAEQAAARETVALGGRMATYAETFGALKIERDRAYDGTADDYVAGVLGDHDTTAEAVIAETPEPLRPRVTQQLAARRLALQGQAMDFEAQAEQAQMAGSVRDAGSQLVNGILSSPSLYETSIADIDQIVSGLPANLRATARSGLLNDATEAYVSGLIREGQEDAALSQLNSGALDSRLTPDSKARLLNAATTKSEALGVDDWMDRLRLEGAVEDDIASRATTGVGVGGVDIGQVASVLGEREAAQYALAIEAAERTHASLTGFAQMTPAQIRAQVAGMAPQPGQAGFAEAQVAYQTAARAAEAEIKAREDDPAAWALRNAPSLSGGLSALGSGDQEAARRAAGSYARGQLALQETAGIEASERRILPKSAAAGMVTAAEQNRDPAEGLRGLGQLIAAFAPPAGADGQAITAATARQRMVISELQQAGADNGDIAAAVDLAGDPVRLGRYVAADRNNALGSMDKDDRESLERAVAGAIGPYTLSFQGLPRSQELINGRMLMAQRLAAERIRSRGGSVREAAGEAAEVLAGRYTFVGPTGWRMPAAIANRREPGGGATFHQTLAQRGAARTLSALGAQEGRGFFTPTEDNGRGLTAAQRRERYADSVRERGRWVATPDDRGLALVHPTLTGGWTAALDSRQQPIVRSWDQLIDAGRDRRPSLGQARQTGGGGGGSNGQRAPRGIRNHNPGNIRAGPTRWQGQVGIDPDGFAIFETPQHGIRALAVDLGTKMNDRGLTTVRGILSRYAPPSENNTEAYIARVATALGVGANTRLDPGNRAQVRNLMAAIIQHENGQQPYALALLEEGQRRGSR